MSASAADPPLPSVGTREREAERAGGTWQRAIPSKAVEMVEELLRNGADPNTSEEGGLTALQLAVVRSCPVAVVASLLRAGADPDAPGPRGSALQLAGRGCRLPRALPAKCAAGAGQAECRLPVE